MMGRYNSPLDGSAMRAALQIVLPAVSACVLVWVWHSTLLVCVMGTCHLALPGALHYGGLAYLIVVTFIQTMHTPPPHAPATQSHTWAHETDLSEQKVSRPDLWWGTPLSPGRHCGMIKASLVPFQAVGTQLPLAVAFEVRSWSYQHTQHRPELYGNTCRHVHVASRPSLPRLSSFSLSWKFCDFTLSRGNTGWIDVFAERKNVT